MNTTSETAIRTNIGTAHLLCACVLGALTAAQSLASGSLSYSATNITERWQNDGGFNSAQNYLTITLTGDNFANLPANTDFIAGGQVTATNVPYGLTPVAIRTKTNQVTVSLSGFAGTNGPSASTNGLQFVFHDSAFSNGPASSITWAIGSNLTVSFLSTLPSIWYVSAGSGYDTQGTGANQGDGSAGHPWKTITNAYQHAQASANDVIHLGAGTYNQAATITIGKTITFQGDNPANTIIQPVTAGTQIFAYSGGYNSMFQNVTMQNGGNAIYQNQISPDLIVSNCWFFNNTSGSRGGAVYNFNNGGATGAWGLRFFACVFTNNVCITGSDAGGAVASYNLPMWFNNCQFIGNMAGSGGGGAIWSYSATIPIVNSTFIANTAIGGSGGAFSTGSGGGTVLVDHSLFASNSAPAGGGALSAWTVVITNSTFYGNTATNGLGGAVNSGANSTAPLIYNSTFAYNTASSGGALRCVTAPTIISSILASNIAVSAPDYTGTTPATVSSSLIGNYPGGTGVLLFGLPNASGNYIGNAATNAQAGILPLANNGGQEATCALLPTSVAIDHGQNPLNLAYDARGAPYLRVCGSQADIGSYESGDPILPSFVYSSTLFAGTTDGRICTTNAITLSSTGSDTLSGTNGQDFVSSTWLMCSNVPSGLTVTATRISSTNLSVTMIGKAGSPANVFNIVFAFNSNAVVTSQAVSNGFNYVGNQSVANISAIFTAGYGSPSLLYSSSLFNESAANDGSVTNTITITLTNALFVDNSVADFVGLGRLQVSNVPAGLTARAFLLEPYRFPQILTVSLSGNASAHNSPNNASLLFAFQDSAFYNVSAASVSSAVTNVQIQFLNPVLAYGSKAFNESWRNDGSIGNTIAATLVGDTFNGAIGEDLYASGKVKAQNLPSGLTPAVVVQSATGLVIALTGNASPNTSAQNTGSLGLTFTNAAFAANQASLVTNYNESDLSVTFLSLDPANWYVNGSTGSETYAGTSAGAAFLSITNAIKHAQANANDVIHIAAGTYTITNQPAISISKSLTFAGTNAALTILQASAAPQTATNGIFSYAATGDNAMFMNLTLQNGVAPAGGAIFASSFGSDLIASNCVFKNNSATNNYGGAIVHFANTAATYLTLLSCIFSNNVATNRASEVGGAIYYGNDTLTISNCVFIGNSAYANGGALYSTGAGGSIVNTLFMTNTTLTGGGGAGYYSGAGALGIYGCTFASNSAPLGGGGLYVKGPLAVTNSTFYGNTSTNGVGGGIYSGYGNGNAFSFLVCNSTIFGNTATNGGGIAPNYTEGAIYSSIIAGNTALSGLAPDIYPNQTTTALWATNSLIGATNSTGSNAQVPSLTNAAALNMPNASGNYCGTAAAPQNPGLLPLTANGGPVLGSTAGSWPTYTCALQPTSVAIDHGCNPFGLITDQRGAGYARQSGVAVDMGAIENGSHLPVNGSAIFFR